MAHTKAPVYSLLLFLESPLSEVPPITAALFVNAGHTTTSLLIGGYIYRFYYFDM